MTARATALSEDERPDVARAMTFAEELARARAERREAR